MTNIDNLSGPANAMYHTVWAGTLSSDIIWSAATHQHLMQVNGLSLWRPWRTVIQILPPCVRRTGESTDESHTSLSPSSAATCLVLGVFWQCEWKGAELFRVTHWNSRFNSHQASEWAGTQPDNICDHEPRLISVHRGLLSYHEIPTVPVFQAKAFLK